MIRLTRCVSVSMLFVVLCAWVQAAIAERQTRESSPPHAASTWARESRKAARVFVAKAATASPVDATVAAPFDTNGSVSALQQTIADLQAQNNPALESALRKLGSQYFYLQQRAYPNDKVDWSAYQRAVEQRDERVRVPVGRIRIF